MFKDCGVELFFEFRKARKLLNNYLHLFGSILSIVYFKFTLKSFEIVSMTLSLISVKAISL
jgi:hypothetical protein